MRVRSAADGRSHAVSLTRGEYERLLDAAATHRKRLVVRLGGEVGLRAAEMTRIRPSDRRAFDTERGAFFLAVPGENGRREAYLPTAVERELTRYVNSNAIADAEPIVGVSPRRVQMLVSGVADRAADRTGIEDFRKVSAHDLRRYFARTLLDRGIDPRIVKAIGGWERFDALTPYLDEPTDAEIVTAFEPTPRTPALDALDETLIEAATRAELEREVCATIADDPAYAFAWIDRTALGTSETGPDAVAGIDGGAISSLRRRVSDGLDDPVSLTAPSIDGTPAVFAVPIAYDETRYGLLGVASARGGFDPDGRDRLAVLGRRIGHAVTAIRRRKLLLADTIIELEFHTTDANAFFVAASDRCDCRVTVESIVQGSDSTLVYYVTLTDGSAAAVFDLAEEFDGIEDWRLVEGRDDGALAEFVVGGASPILVIHDYGATITEATFDRGTARILADCAYDADLRTLVDGVTDAFPDSELVGKQTVDRSARTVQAFRQGAEERLTDRQRAALHAAYFGGYFDWPRDSTAEEIADAMGVSSPTLHNHLRKGQRELLRTLFDDR